MVVIGATNRPNLIDPAVLRAGRFDELIYVGVPSEAGRRRILDIQTQKMPLAADVDLDVVARRTDRFTGADLAMWCAVPAWWRCVDRSARIRST